jgi:hypothetical protein
MAAWFRQATGKTEVWLGFSGFREEGGDKERGRRGPVPVCPRLNERQTEMSFGLLASTGGRRRRERVESLLRGSCGLRERLWSGALLAKSWGGIL